MVSVLMVCTGNICRSPMAEGMLKRLLSPPLAATVCVKSAGTHALHGNRAEPFAVKAAAHHGADISGHRARLLDGAMVKSTDLILTMESHHLEIINDLLFFGCRHARLLGSFNPGRSHPEIEDPYGLSMEHYRTCAAEINACLPGVIDHLRQMAAPDAR